MIIERVKEDEIREVAKMCQRSAFESMTPFYAPSVIKECVENALSEEAIAKRISWTHFYVAKIDSRIVGCGAIGPFWGSEVESSLFTIYVDVDFQGKGIGKKIIEVLENDEFAKRARRIQIPAAIPAIPFYKKCGYEHRDDKMTFDEGHFEMEKFMQ